MLIQASSCYYGLSIFSFAVQRITHLSPVHLLGTELLCSTLGHWCRCLYTASIPRLRVFNTAIAGVTWLQVPVCFRGRLYSPEYRRPQTDAGKSHEEYKLMGWNPAQCLTRAVSRHPPPFISVWANVSSQTPCSLSLCLAIPPHPVFCLLIN